MTHQSPVIRKILEERTLVRNQSKKIKNLGDYIKKYHSLISFPSFDEICLFAENNLENYIEEIPEYEKDLKKLIIERNKKDKLFYKSSLRHMINNSLPNLDIKHEIIEESSEGFKRLYNRYKSSATRDWTSLTYSNEGEFFELYKFQADGVSFQSVAYSERRCALFSTKNSIHRFSYGFKASKNNKTYIDRVITSRGYSLIPVVEDPIFIFLDIEKFVKKITS